MSRVGGCGNEISQKTKRSCLRLITDDTQIVNEGEILSASQFHWATVLELSRSAKWIIFKF